MEICFAVFGAIIAAVVGFVFAGALVVRLRLTGIDEVDMYLFGTLLCSFEGGLLAYFVSANFGPAAGIIALFTIGPAVILTWTAIFYFCVMAFRVLLVLIRCSISHALAIGSIVSFLADRCADCVRAMLPPAAKHKSDHEKDD